MAIGQRIKFFRNRKGMTQKQLGEQLDIERMEKSNGEESGQ
jgi:transcriptional regulator with XRE-family HTH domain